MSPEHHLSVGQHVVADVFELSAEQLADTEGLLKTLIDGARLSGADVLGNLHHSFQPHGYTALVLLSESHVSVHTFPEHGSLYFDAFTCGTASPVVIFDHLLKFLDWPLAQVSIFSRGDRLGGSQGSGLEHRFEQRSPGSSDRLI